MTMGLCVLLRKKSQSIQYFDFKDAGGFLGLILVSIIAAFGIILGAYMALVNTRRNSQDLQRASKQTRAAGQLLKTIDLGFASAPSNKTSKANSQNSDSDQSTDQLNVKTVMNVISELSDDLKNKIKKLTRTLKCLPSSIPNYAIPLIPCMRRVARFVQMYLIKVVTHLTAKRWVSVEVDL